MTEITSIKKSAWITWEHQRRNISMSNLIKSDYYEFNVSTLKAARYPICIFKTIKVFLKPYSIIFVQNPSIILSFVSVLLGKILSKKIVIDAHNAGIRPLEGRLRIIQIINNWILKNSNLVIVTNKKLKAHLDYLSIPNIVFPDPLPQINPPTNKNPNEHNFDVLIVCSWSEDEPLIEYLEAAKENKEMSFAFTGRYESYIKNKSKIEIPNNVCLLGFVSEEEYNLLLIHSKVIIDLTKREDCLVCGAYEAISLGKTIILSDTAVNRELFKDAAFYSDISVPKINASLREASKNSNKMDKLIRNFKNNYEAMQRENLNRLFYLINQ
jgi:glycosyltransferase involved in cell wall biosynthesis